MFFVCQNKAKKTDETLWTHFDGKNMTHHVLELFPAFERVCFFAVLIASHPSSYLSVFLAAKRSEGS